jgi:WhiB family redox-sensing transcriptional regulator
LCLEYPELTWFPERGQSSAPAKAVCGRCLVQRECLGYALADPDLMGVWGGISMRERAQLRKAAVLHEVA